MHGLKLVNGYHVIDRSFTRSANLTHWGWVMHTCISKRTNIGSDNGLPPGRRQAIIWTKAGILLIEPFVINCSEIFVLRLLNSRFQKTAIYITNFEKHFTTNDCLVPHPCCGTNIILCKLGQHYGNWWPGPMHQPPMPLQSEGMR